ncbi:D-glycero-alpha-D-manno-heptose-1,7-bisphosphate 7-phosphatase [Calidifontibacter terrae]
MTGAGALKLSDAELGGLLETPLRRSTRSHRARWDLVLLDRDGTLNVHRPGYVERPADLELIAGVGPRLAAINRTGSPVVVVTNQQGVGKGRMSIEDLALVHRRLVDLLADHGAWVDGFAVCPHLTGSCDCRKPADGLFRRVLRRAPWADVRRTVMVGDNDSDLLPALRLGCAVLKVPSGRWPAALDW